MQGKKNTISEEDVRKDAEGKLAFARIVEGFVKHKGFKMMLDTFGEKFSEIKNKSDYKTLEDFKADRKAIDIVHEMLEELFGHINDAELAADTLSKLKEAESQTPSLLSVDGEGMEE